jgi:hypothetical protein
MPSIFLAQKGDTRGMVDIDERVREVGEPFKVGPPMCTQLEGLGGLGSSL